MSFRDTALQLARRAPGNFIGVIYRAASPQADLAARWQALAFASSAALRDWYEELAGSPTLYLYIAAFDKSQSAASPVAETIAPPKPGDPTWGAFWTLQQQGYRWRAEPYGAALAKDRPAVSGAFVGAEDRPHEPRWVPVVLIGAMFGVAWFATSREVSKIQRDREANQRRKL